jgi:hypothetical protein
MTRPGTVLTGRDLALLRSLVTLRFLTAAQVERLHFPSEQTALRRLRRLEEAGVVRRTAVPTVASQLVTLTSRGLESAIDGDAAGSGSEAVRLPKLPGPLFVRHLVAVNDFRIALTNSLWRHADVELLQFESDSDRRWAGPGRPPCSLLQASIAIPGEEPIRHAPDGAFLLQRQNRRGLFLLEVDCGTEVIAQPRRGVGRLVRFSLHALAQGRLHALFPALACNRPPEAIRVLVLTTSQRRQENIRRHWGGKHFTPEAAKRLVWLGNFDQHLTGDLISAPWVSLDPEDSEPHRIAADPKEEE